MNENKKRVRVIFCPNCGKPMSPDLDRCTACGAKLYKYYEEEAAVDVENENKEMQRPQNGENGTAFCPVCGKRVRDGHFCPECGACLHPQEKVQKTGNKGQPQISEKKETKKKNYTGLIVLTIALVLCLLAGGYYLLVIKRTVSLGGYAKVKFNGYDGYGTAEVSVDGNALATDYGDQLKLTEEGKQYQTEHNLANKEETIAYIVKNTDAVSLSRNDRLENGDTVTLTWNVDRLKKYVIGQFREIKSDQKVSGLTEVKKIDVFQYVDVSFTGMNGEGTATLNTAKLSEAYPDVELKFSFDRESGLANGDKVTLSVDDKSIVDQVEKTGIVPTEESETLSVDGLVNFLSSMDAITSDQLKSLTDTGKNSVSEGISVESNEIELKDVEYIGYYFLLNKNWQEDLKDGQPSDDNRLGLVYRTTYHITESESGQQQDYDCYVIISYKDVYLDDDHAVAVHDQSSFKTYETQHTIDVGNYKYYFSGYQTLDEAEKGYTDQVYSQYTLSSDVA
jgi:DNA-directed RNA polymerase subunit M/transcription elongation factor TFIIS